MCITPTIVCLAKSQNHYINHIVFLKIIVIVQYATELMHYMAENYLCMYEGIGSIKNQVFMNASMISSEGYRTRMVLKETTKSLHANVRICIKNDF